jgi:bacteriorhodopsin
VLTLLVGALVASSYKWGYFVFSLLALFGVAYNLLWSGRRYASRLGGSVSRTYTAVAAWLVGFWFLYPIAWGVSEGGNVIGIVGEMVFYGVLDVLTKLGFIALLLWGHRQIDPAVLGIASRDYDDEVATEKRHPEIGNPVPAAPQTTGMAGGVVEPGVEPGVQQTAV